jgi:hypothetical protein
MGRPPMRQVTKIRREMYHTDEIARWLYCPREIGRNWAKLEREHEIMKSFAACLRASSVLAISMKLFHTTRFGHISVSASRLSVVLTVGRHSTSATGRSRL